MAEATLAVVSMVAVEGARWRGLDFDLSCSRESFTRRRRRASLGESRAWRRCVEAGVEVAVGVVVWWASGAGWSLLEGIAGATPAGYGWSDIMGRVHVSQWDRSNSNSSRADVCSEYSDTWMWQGQVEQRQDDAGDRRTSGGVGWRRRRRRER